MIKFLFVFVVTYAVVELFLFLLLDALRTRYPGKFLTYKDQNPTIPQKGLNKFFAIGYDPELGWVRKPNTSKIEKNVVGESTYHIDEIGSRRNPGYEKKPMKVVSYGDSYTFCREVNDDETWQHYLAKDLKCNVGNFGVGNYGLDQSLLRFKRELPTIKNAQLLVVGVVPQTIQRNLSIWKHYLEFGNTFGFKPRFVFDRGALRLIRNPIDKPHKFFEIRKYLFVINKYDYFYKSKFKKSLYQFPYVFSLFSKKRFVKLVTYLGVTCFDFLGIPWRKWSFLPVSSTKKIIDTDHKTLVAAYQDREITQLMYALLRKFRSAAKKNGMNVLFLIMPTLEDLRYIKKTGNVYYQPLLDQFTECVDLSGPLLKKDFSTLFYSRKESKHYIDYGAHYSPKGNRFVADVLYKVIKNRKLV